MNTHATESDGECLTLESKLSEIARVPPWMKNSPPGYGIPSQIQFAMDLCLEEILSNIIRHGYAGEPNHAVVIRHQINREGSFTLIVEDQAPQFNPLLVSDPPVPSRSKRFREEATALNCSSNLPTRSITSPCQMATGSRSPLSLMVPLKPTLGQPLPEIRVYSSPAD